MVRVEEVRVQVLPGGLIDRGNAAVFLGRKPQTLAVWAMRGFGPKPQRDQTGQVFYDFKEVEAFRRGELPQGGSAESEAA